MGKITYDKLKGEDAVRLDELFGVKDCLIEVNPGKVLLPPDFEKIGDRILDFKVRPDDVWLVSYPRTGSTWTQEMVWLIGNDLDYELAKTAQHIRTPLLELTAIMMNHPDWLKGFGNSVDMVDQIPSPRFIKSHLPLDILPKQLDEVKPKIIYVARNPKDMCVSYYHYCLLIHNLKGTFEEFCELFLKDMAPIGPVWNHILGFWKKRNDPNVLFLTYEEMKRDQKGAIRRCAKFMNKEISEEEVERLETHLSFNKMKENPAVNLEAVIAAVQTPEQQKNTDLKFIRKGQVGDYKNHMTPEIIERFDKWTEEHIQGTGLTFD